MIRVACERRPRTLYRRRKGVVREYLKAGRYSVVVMLFREPDDATENP